MPVRRVTIRDVARAAGVTPAVVSIVLNDRRNSTVRVSTETRGRVQRIARELEYRPGVAGRGRTRRKSRVIGILLNELNVRLVADVLQGVQDAVASAQYSPLVFIHGDGIQERLDLQRSLDRQVDALIVDTCDLPPEQQTIDEYRRLSREGFPIVELFGASIPDVPRVNVDFCGDGRRATARLVELGHKSIALVVHDQYKDRDRYWSAWEFFRGYTDGMTMARLEPSVVTVPLASRLGCCPSQLESGRRAAQDILRQQPRPTAVVCYGNCRALGMLKELQAQRVAVPDEISVLGYYEAVYAPLGDPPLSTFAIDARGAGRAAAYMAFDLMNSRSARDGLVASTWIEGRTIQHCAAPAAAVR